MSATNQYSHISTKKTEDCSVNPKMFFMNFIYFNPWGDILRCEDAALNCSGALLK